MENVSVLNNAHFRMEFLDEVKFNSENTSFGSSSFSPAIINMIEEGGISFLSYLKSLGLSRESNLMVLSSKHHYYYDEDELKSIRTLVNLKKLNLIKHPHSFLNILFRILPSDANFIGCFSDNRPSKGNSLQPSRLLNRFINILDSRTDRVLSKDEVAGLLLSHGFRVIDMTEIEGLTYFYSKPEQNHAELRA